jgi:hypothetical protein
MSGMPEQYPPRPPAWQGRDLRPIAIGAAAGLLVLVVGGIALAASQPGAPITAQQPPQADHGGPGGNGGEHGPGGNRGPGSQVPPRIEHRFPNGGPGPGRLPLGAAIGPEITISAISGSDITLQTASGWTRTITVTDATTILRAGQKIAVTDLKVGDAVRLMEARNEDGSTTISQIDVVLPRVLGRVTATAADSITVQRADGTSMTIHVDASTTYDVRGVTNATLADIKVGMTLVAQGSQNADGSLQALSVKAAALR